MLERLLKRLDNIDRKLFFQHVPVAQNDGILTLQQKPLAPPPVRSQCNVMATHRTSVLTQQHMSLRSVLALSRRPSRSVLTREHWQSSHSSAGAHRPIEIVYPLPSTGLPLSATFFASHILDAGAALDMTGNGKLAPL